MTQTFESFFKRKNYRGLIKCTDLQNYIGQNYIGLIKCTDLQNYIGQNYGGQIKCTDLQNYRGQINIGLNLQRGVLYLRWAD